MIFTAFALLFYFRISNILFALQWRNSPTRAPAALLLKILDHIKLEAHAR